MGADGCISLIRKNGIGRVVKRLPLERVHPFQSVLFGLVCFLPVLVCTTNRAS